MTRPSRWITFLRRAGLVGATLLTFAVPRPIAAQSLADLAAWDALVVTPVGALPPRARVFETPAPKELAIRYGRWRYDIDDAIHNDFGVTVARDVNLVRGSVAVTAAYLSLSCGTCEAWVTTGAEVQSTVLSRRISADSGPELNGTLGLRLNGGMARFLGDGHATAFSASGSAVIGIAGPWIEGTEIGMALMPGIGIGRFSSVDETAYGTLPILGAAAALELRHGVVIDVGFQRIYIDGGPTQFGAGFAWRFR